VPTLYQQPHPEWWARVVFAHPTALLRYNFQTARSLLRFPDSIFKRRARNDGSHTSAFSRCEAPERCMNFCPRDVRAQGMPGARCTRGRVCNKKAHALATTGTPQSTGIPCAIVLTVYFVLSPVTGLFFLPPSLAGSCPTTLAPASGRQDHTFRRLHRCARPATPFASTASRLNFHGDREPHLS
jgi:hypothetical protein